MAAFRFIICKLIIILTAGILNVNFAWEDNSKFSNFSEKCFKTNSLYCFREQDWKKMEYEIHENVYNQLQQDLSSKGRTPYLPATSCKEILREYPESPSGFYWIKGKTSSVQVHCNMTVEQCNSPERGWTRIAFLNMTDPSQSCPVQWRSVGSGELRMCGRSLNDQDGAHNGGCSSVNFSAHGISYSYIRGRVIGYQSNGPRGFGLFRRVFDIEGPYMDGVSLTHGHPRNHIWSFAAAWAEGTTTSYACACTNPQASTSVPHFVGNDYFCETANPNSYGLYKLWSEDPLWDGNGCGPTSTCCEFNNPPWFCKHLPQSTTDDIEVRICANSEVRDADSPVELLELYVN